MLVATPRALSLVIVPSHVQAARRPEARQSMPLGSLDLAERQCVTWSPQDLTKKQPGFPPVPDDDYIKKYQKNPELWPVEFFLIAYRRTSDGKTEVLVRRSSNGTSKWGVGTGVPATRWMISTQEQPPRGYRRCAPPITFEASGFPEFPKDGSTSWTYDKIEIRGDAFSGQDATAFRDLELEEYAHAIREGLKAQLAEQVKDGATTDSWEAERLLAVRSTVDRANSRAAIQGTLRMSGLFSRRRVGAAGAEGSPRYVSLGKVAPDPTKLVQSTRIFTMFPQMPDPIPLPSALPEELQLELATRDARMEARGRDPHKDVHGRTYTHRSTPNVSNTIHGVYLILDATGMPELDDVPALDLFGAKEFGREWVSLQDLEVLDAEGAIGTVDTKPTFISGFIVRQLVKDGVIAVDGPSRRSWC